MTKDFIPKERFADLFRRIGWKFSVAKSGKYDIWTSPLNEDFWTVIPSSEKAADYNFYQQKNVKVILSALSLEETSQNINEVYSQLEKYNYKIINKIVNKGNENQVSFELANTITNKNIDAFKFFYQSKSRGKSIPTESFQLHHTQKGSFVIPISISAEEEQEKLVNIPSRINSIIKDYLKKIEILINEPQKDEKEFSDSIIEAEIDSKIVKDFLSESENSIAKVKTKYEKEIEGIYITSTGNPILDFRLSKEEKTFPQIDVKKAKTLSESFLNKLEEREIEADSSTIEQHGVNIDVQVDSLDKTGTVKFSVFGIAGSSIEKPFKARSTKLTQKRLNFLADAFKSRETIVVSGDIIKSKGKVGEIISDGFNLKQKNPTLFDKTTQNE